MISLRDPMLMVRRLRSFLTDRAGVAAVEFALIAPMMVLLMFGSLELVNALQTSRRVQNVASSVADVVARDTAVSDLELTGIWSALTPLMFPDATAGLDVRVTSIQIASTSSARVVWCETQGGYNDISDNSPVTGLPSGMMVAGTSIIRVETRYSYVPILGFWTLRNGQEILRNTSPMTVSHVAYSRSRLVDPIPRIS